MGLQRVGHDWVTLTFALRVSVIEQRVQSNGTVRVWVLTLLCADSVIRGKCSEPWFLYLEYSGHEDERNNTHIHSHIQAHMHTETCLAHVEIKGWSNLFAVYFGPKRASLVAQTVKNLPAMWETWVQSLGWEDPLEEGTATLSNFLAWRIPWTV